LSQWWRRRLNHHVGQMRRALEKSAAWPAVLSPRTTGGTYSRLSNEALFAAFTPEIELQIHEACAGADLGFIRGHNGGRLVSRASGEARSLDDAFMMMLRLEGGVWRISHLIWHRQSPATPLEE
jgi:hypothetical protein